MKSGKKITPKGNKNLCKCQCNHHTIKILREMKKMKNELEKLYKEIMIIFFMFCLKCKLVGLENLVYDPLFCLLWQNSWYSDVNKEGINLKKKSLVSVGGDKGHHDGDGSAAGHAVPSDTKQREWNAGLAFSVLFSPESQSAEWLHPHVGWSFQLS